MLKKIATISFCVLAAVCTVSGQVQETVFLDGGHGMFDQNTAANNPLTGGTAADGNGAVIQLGWFSGPNFTGNFNLLAGAGSPNNAPVAGSSPSIGYNQISIGDTTSESAGNGTFFLTLNFVVGNANSGNNLPAAGTQLALRFYNGTSIANSSFYNTVTDSLWTWQAPNSPPNNPTVTISLDDTNLVWESISALNQPANTAFHTTIAVIPEPSTIASLLLGGGLLGLVLRRRK